MNLLKDKEALRQLIGHIDNANTLNGGVMAANAQVSRTEETVELTVLAPSVHPDLFNIYLNNNFLVISAPLVQPGEAYPAADAAPLFQQAFPVPPFIDVDRIEAHYDDGKLRVVLPFREDTSQGARRIDVRY